MKPVWYITLSLFFLYFFSAPVFSAVPMEAMHQLDRLSESAAGEGGWFLGPDHEDWRDWYYTVADLNQNGRVEVWKVKMRHSGGASDIRYTEVLDGGTLASGSVRMKGDIPVPDIFSYETGAYPVLMSDSENGEYHYIFVEKQPKEADILRYVKYALTLKGEPVMELLAAASEKESGVESISLARYYIPEEGAGWREVSSDRYDGIQEERFPGCRMTRRQFKWLGAEYLSSGMAQGYLTDFLTDSYDVFLNGSWLELEVPAK